MKEIEPKIPSDLKKVLVANPKAMKLWKEFTPISHRDWISWVESAKQPETRKRRIEQTPSKILSGKRRPCCYALVPMNLYKELGVNPKAKIQWRELTPDERRDFVAWIDEATDKEARGVRIIKACSMLAFGKRRP